MPPKGKKNVKKTTPSAVVDIGRSPTEMSKDELWDLALRLQEELGMMKKQRRDFLLEADKAQTSWETTTKNQEEEQTKLRNRRREMEEERESRREEITIYQQKLKHVQSEQSSSVTQLKVDAASSSSQLQHHNRESVLELHKQVHALQADCREKQIEQEILIKDLLLKHHMEKMEMVRDHRVEEHEAELDGHQRRTSLMMETLRELKNVTVYMDKTMKTRVESLIKEHNTEMETALVQLNDTRKKLQKKEMSKNLVQKIKDLLSQEEKDLNLELSKNKCLREKLSELEQERDVLQRKTPTSSNNKDKMARHHRQTEVVTRERTDWTVRLELLRQAVQEVEEQLNELQRKQTETVLDAQQKSGLKTLTLERKIAAMTETLERKQAQLYTVLCISSSDPETRRNSSQTLQELIESMKKRISALQEDIAQHSEEYNKLLHDTEERRPPETCCRTFPARKPELLLQLSAADGLLQQTVPAAPPQLKPLDLVFDGAAVPRPPGTSEPSASGSSSSSCNS